MSGGSKTWVTVSSPSVGRLRFRTLRLTVTEGPDRGKQVTFADGRVRVGSRAENELALTDPLVSGLHLEVQVEPQGVRLRDLGSTNGTWVGGMRVVDIYPAQGALVALGRSVLRLDAADGATELRLPAEDHFGPLVGASPAMRELFGRLARIAAADVPVLITGETGTGKEVVASAIHEASARAREPFVAVECAAIPATLIESELFGFERGAFTGAERSFPGAFERAGAGTIFLDELGELPLAVQPKLLRVLESLEVRRLGAERARPVAARIVAATNRNVARMVNQGSFRDDLYYRLAVAEVHLPPLRERPDDIPLLCRHFASRIGSGPRSALDERALAGFLGHSWPGNVRELRNAVQRLLLLGEAPAGPVATEGKTAAGAASIMLAADLGLPYKEARDALLDIFRARYTRAILDKAGGAVATAARLAGVDRMTFYRLLKRRGSE